MNINTFEELLTACKSENKRIYEIAQENEAQKNDMSIQEIRQIVKTNIIAMKDAIKTGLTSDEKSFSGMSGGDCQKLQNKFATKPSLLGVIFEKITTYALATSEENARMGKIVACPTAGSCGIVPSVLISVSEEINATEEEQINALITAGEIGRIISNKVQLAGAVAGCQAECGVASAMAAGALAQLKGEPTENILSAVALAMKNLLGLTCDPVCGLVEVPCIKRNPFLGVHAVTAYELASAGIQSLIPLDEIIDTLEQTGQLMSPSLKESSQAGLAKTKTGIKLEEKFFSKQ